LAPEDDEKLDFGAGVLSRTEAEKLDFTGVGFLLKLDF